MGVMTFTANKAIIALGDVRKRCTVDGDVPSLLAAAEAVLNLHKPVNRGRVMHCCEGCEAVNGEFHEDCCHEWPCPTYEAVAEAITTGWE